MKTKHKRGKSKSANRTFDRALKDLQVIREVSCEDTQDLITVADGVDNVLCGLGENPYLDPEDLTHIGMYLAKALRAAVSRARNNVDKIDSLIIAGRGACSLLEQYRRSNQSQGGEGQ